MTATPPSTHGSTLAWINATTSPTHAAKSLADADAQKIVAALNLQAPAVAKAWGVPANQHVFVASVGDVPAGALKAYFLRDADVAGALGYHDVDPQGDPYIRVFVDTVLQNGGTVLTGSASVSACASHEAAEEAADPQCTAYSVREANGNEVAIEVADPVENSSYPVTLPDGTQVAVSDFVFPSFFDPHGQAPFDQMGLVQRPFQILSGGYEIVKSRNGRVHQVFGEDYAAWRQEMKQSPASRTYRRLHSRRRS